MRKILVQIIIILLSILINYFEWEIGLKLIILSMLFSSSFLMYKQLRILWKYFTYYMFNIKINFFEKRIERPRLFIYLTIGTASLIVFRIFINLETNIFFNNILLSSLLLVTYWVFTYILYFTWSSEFYEKFILKIERQILKTENKSFQIEWTREQIKQLYNNLVDSDFIELINEKSEIEDQLLFIQLLTDGNIPETPVFKLNMNNVQTKYFWDLLSQNNKGFTLDIFLKIFTNKNENTTRSSIEVSFSKASNRFNKKAIIDQCFSF